MENMFDSGALVSGSFDIGAIDYSGSSTDPGTAYPTSVLDGGGISPAWDSLFRTSVAKGLDYFIAKDAYQTRAGLPGGYPATYYRGADGRLYQSNGMPVGGVTMQGQASGNGMLLLIVLGAVLLLRKG